MTPHPRFKALCERQFSPGGEYILAVPEYATTASRNHYFAVLHDAWMNLPDEEAKRFPTSEYFRKWLLVKAGFAQESSIVCDSARDAKSLAVTARSLDPYAVIVVSGKVVKIYTAKSQTAAAMGKEEFQKSKTDVLDKIAELIEVTPKQLRREGERQFPEPKQGERR